MTGDRYQALFQTLAEKHDGAFVPFVILGDPTPEASLGVIRALVAAGADALELGIPFSDPIADGPTIQAAAVRALAAGTTPGTCFELLEQLRRELPAIPIGLLVYANLVVVAGEDDFYRRAARAGVDSILVADVPVFESAPFVAAAGRHGIQPVLIVPPNIDEQRLEVIARTTRGYTYVVARSGVTGAGERLTFAGASLFDRLADHGAPPAVVGFGISSPEHVRTVLEAGAAGAISGSAVVRLIERQLGDQAAILAAVNDLVGALKAATVGALRSRSPVRIEAD